MEFAGTGLDPEGTPPVSCENPAGTPPDPDARVLFPLFIDMRNRPVLLIGGGAVAERRAQILLRFGAAVTVLSPEITPEIARLTENKKLRYIRKEYEPGDIARAAPFLIIAATGRREVNRAVGEEASARGVLAVIADDWRGSPCFFPALAESEAFIAGLTSKNGNHKGTKDMAKQIRRALTPPAAKEREIL